MRKLVQTPTEKSDRKSGQSPLSIRLSPKERKYLNSLAVKNKKTVSAIIKSIIRASENIPSLTTNLQQIERNTIPAIQKDIRTYLKGLAASFNKVVKYMEKDGRYDSLLTKMEGELLSIQAMVNDIIVRSGGSGMQHILPNLTLKQQTNKTFTYMEKIIISGKLSSDGKAFTRKDGTKRMIATVACVKETSLGKKTSYYYVISNENSSLLARLKKDTAVSAVGTLDSYIEKGEDGKNYGTPANFRV
ncbi:MAG: hypothetical protein IJ652_05090 [Bacteroidales bacterium]|nr:hypothetical protein [Bacteroidales bacterium]